MNQSNLDVVTAVTSKMSTALTSLSSGLASIANQRALSRVQTQIKAATASLSSGTIPATSSKAIPVNLLSLDTIGTAADTTGNVVDKTA